MAGFVLLFFFFFKQSSEKERRGSGNWWKSVEVRFWRNNLAGFSVHGDTKNSKMKNDEALSVKWWIVTRADNGSRSLIFARFRLPETILFGSELQFRGYFILTEQRHAGQSRVIRHTLLSCFNELLNNRAKRIYWLLESLMIVHESVSI